MWVNALADPGGNGSGSDDLAHPLARQHVWCWTRTFLAADEQRPGPPRANVQPKQLRQVTPDRHLPALSALALMDGDHALGQADILDTKLDKLRGPGAGLQQRLQHQPGTAVASVGLIEEAELFFNCQPIDAAAMFRDRPQTGALPRGFEDGLALRVVYA